MSAVVERLRADKDTHGFWEAGDLEGLIAHILIEIKYEDKEFKLQAQAALIRKLGEALRGTNGLPWADSSPQRKALAAYEEWKKENGG